MIAAAQSRHLDCAGLAGGDLPRADRCDGGCLIELIGHGTERGPEAAGRCWWVRSACATAAPAPPGRCPVPASGLGGGRSARRTARWRRGVAKRVGLERGRAWRSRRLGDSPASGGQPGRADPRPRGEHAAAENQGPAINVVTKEKRDERAPPTGDRGHMGAPRVATLEGRPLSARAGARFAIREDVAGRPPHPPQGPHDGVRRRSRPGEGRKTSASPQLPVAGHRIHGRSPRNRRARTVERSGGGGGRSRRVTIHGARPRRRTSERRPAQGESREAPSTPRPGTPAGRVGTTLRRRLSMIFQRDSVGADWRRGRRRAGNARRQPRQELPVAADPPVLAPVQRR